MQVTIIKINYEIIRQTEDFLIQSCDRIWSVVGGELGLTCNGSADYVGSGFESSINGSFANGANGSDLLYCKDLIIPDCVDRTVYCSDPPQDSADFSGGKQIMTLLSNPSPYYMKTKGL